MASVSETPKERGLRTISGPKPATRSEASSPVTDTDSPKFLTIQQVCDRLNLSRTTVWRIMNQHGLRFVRIGGARRIREQDLESWLEQNTVSLGDNGRTVR